MDDDSLPLVLLLLLCLAAALLGLGGRATPLQGLWQDGTRRVRLRRRACLVGGEAEVDGGRQRFAGLAVFGRVLLWRRDYGEGHLLALGFPAHEVPRLQGRVTGIFWLRLEAGGDALGGAFYGRHFTFDTQGGAIGRFVAGVPRRLTRAAR